MNKVYIRINDKNEIIQIEGGCTEANIKDYSDWIQIDEGEGERFLHCQVAYLPKPIIDLDKRAYNFKYINGEIVEQDLSDYVPPVEEAPQLSYEELVAQKIRLRYSMNDELAILRQRDTKPQEFAEYNSYCEACKAEAREELNL